MTGTSRMLRRLGVAGLGTVVVYSGLVPLTALTANAAVVYPTTNATSIALDKTSDTAAVGPTTAGKVAKGTCNPFTATIPVANPGESFSINIQETVPSSTAAGADDGTTGTHIGFCNPLAANPDAQLGGPLQGPGTAGSNTTSSAGANNDCYNTALTDATHTSTVSCNTAWTDTNKDGKVTFGINSNTVGSMSLSVFDDLAPTNGARDTGSEVGATATKTWVANSATDNTNKVACSPSSASQGTSTTYHFTCKVTNSAGIALSGQVVHFKVAASPAGPDSAQGEATCPATATGAGGTTAGSTTCAITNGGQPGTDTINAWLETNLTPAQQPEEPAAPAITVTWVQGAPVGSILTLTCSPNQQATWTNQNTNDSAICQDPVSDKSVTIKAKVVNGTPAAPQAGILVQFAIDFNSDAADKDSALSAASYITVADGTCSVTVTNPSAIQDQEIEVDATATDQNGNTDDAFVEKFWHDPDANESRNITLTPATSTQPSGGIQTLTAMVVDRFTTPVKGTEVDLSETGPGAFRNGSNTAKCTTDATGKCSVDMASLTTESGDETVTATIADANFTDAAPANECSSPAGYSNFRDNIGGFVFGPNTPSAPLYYNNGGAAPNAHGQNNVATGAAAGNCSTTAKVTWQTGVQNGAVQITSFTNTNPAACSSYTVSGTAPSGASVTLTGFNFHSNTFTIATVTADSSGHWTFTGSGVCYTTNITASTGSGSGATNSNTVTVGFHETFSGVHFTRVGAYRNGLIQYNVSGNSTYVPDEPIRVQNSACRSQLCGITHLRSPGTFNNLHIYLKPGTYTLRLNSTGGTTFDNHQYLNGFTQSFTVTIH